MAKTRLYALFREWQEGCRGPRDAHPYVKLLDELSFQADLRFGDYVQYQEDGTFLVRLERWLANSTNTSEQQALLRFLQHLVFVNDLQMTALYRDAFRRIIDPWLTDPLAGISDMLAADYPERQRARLADYQIASISESFDVGLLLKASDLHGVPRPVILGPDPQRAISTYETLRSEIAGCIICEDIVGTGKQAGRILRAIEDRAPTHWRLLFVPLIAFENGITNLQSAYGLRTIVRPVITLPRTQCLTKEPQAAEPEVFKAIRGIVSKTAARVCDHPDDGEAAFGSEVGGAWTLGTRIAADETECDRASGAGGGEGGVLGSAHAV